MYLAERYERAIERFSFRTFVRRILSDPASAGESKGLCCLRVTGSVPKVGCRAGACRMCAHGTSFANDVPRLRIIPFFSFKSPVSWCL